MGSLRSITVTPSGFLQPDVTNDVKPTTPVSQSANDVTRSRPRSVVTPVTAESGNPVARVLGTGAAVITATAAAVLLVLVLSGIVQDYARRKRYRSGGGAFWNWLACVPSLRYPLPALARVGHRSHGNHIGSIGCKELYKQISLVPYVLSSGALFSLDDWGGFTRFHINTGSGDYLVIWIDDGYKTFGAIDADGIEREFRVATLAECVDLMYKTELLANG